MFRMKLMIIVTFIYRNIRWELWRTWKYHVIIIPMEYRSHRAVSHALSHIIYTGFPRRNLPDFGRVFFMLNYTDITQNTYIRSWTITEIMAREKCGPLAGSTYCTYSVGWHVTRISHVLDSGTQSVSQSVSQSVGVVSALAAYREWRCGELYMRKVYILTMIKWYNIWNQATMLNVWICATAWQHIPNC